MLAPESVSVLLPTLTRLSVSLAGSAITVDQVRSPAWVSKPKVGLAGRLGEAKSVAISASETELPTARAAPGATDQRPVWFQPGRELIEPIARVPAETVVVPV